MANELCTRDDHGSPLDREHYGHGVREPVGGQARFFPINEKKMEVNTPL